MGHHAGAVGHAAVLDCAGVYRRQAAADPAGIAQVKAAGIAQVHVAHRTRIIAEQADVVVGGLAGDGNHMILAVIDPPEGVGGGIPDAHGGAVSKGIIPGIVQVQLLPHGDAGGPVNAA
ncbi:hypothetical protein SDC9_163401 [bioreactor metagenome]|uniref:Uncharacterized protein n=1 Tax=bioreactor metagenome TaxID=1076179 RepID=A0A645FVG4_9ZZZZ